MARWSQIVKKYLMLGTVVGSTLLGLTLTTPAHATIDVTDSFSGIMITEGQQLCNQAVMVCGRQLAPLPSELGGSFTVKINSHFRSTYECSMLRGQPQWVSIISEGTCEEVPIITLPNKYENEADGVG